MEWMLNNQEGRRNLTAVDRLLADEKLRDKILEEAAIKKSNDISESNKKRNSNDDQMVINENEPTMCTRKEIAKIAGVGEGTVQRFDKVMKSGDDELIQKVRNGELTINGDFA